LLIIAVSKSLASESNDESNDEVQEVINLDDDGGNEQVEQEVGSEDEEEEEEEEEEQHVQLHEYSDIDILNQINFSDPETLLANIIGGGIDQVSDIMISSLPPHLIFDLLSDPIGARLAASCPFEIFSQANLNALIIDCIDENFFIHLDLFSENVQRQSLSQVPVDFVVKTIQIHSLHKKFNLMGFIDKFENYDDVLSFALPKALCLPHLFDISQMSNPEYFMGRGISYDYGLSKKDKIIWDISLQLFLKYISTVKSLEESAATAEVLMAFKREISTSRLQLGQDIDFKMNYFGLKSEDEFDFFQVFRTRKLFTFEERSLSLSDLSSSLGFPDFIYVDYCSLGVEDRIVYRLIIYLTIFNPTLMSKSARNDLILDFLKVVPHEDFSITEFKFFTCACVTRKLGDLIAAAFSQAVCVEFRKSIEKILIGSTRSYDSVVDSITSDINRLIFLKRGTAFFKTGLTIENEEFYRKRRANRPTLEDENNNSQDEDENKNSQDEDENKNSQDEDEEKIEIIPRPLVRTKRLRNGDKVPESHFSSHFLSSDQIQSLGPIQSHQGGGGRSTFVIPYPNKDFLNARYDNLMQNLDSPDLGEIEWKKRLAKLGKNEKDAHERNEQDLDEFVRSTFVAINFMSTRPRATIDIVFRGSPSRGEGLKLEAFETFARVILLPRFKLFYYNSELKGFIPYPLLHPEIMASLGFLNRWFLSNDLPLNWNLSGDYLKFLFYEEDPYESMKILIERFYGIIFKNFDGLNVPGINPLDYLPSNFYAHQPLAFHDQDPNFNSPLDLFAPSDQLGNSQYTTIFNYLDQGTIDFLAEIISPPKSEFEESKDDFVEDSIEIGSQSTLIDEYSRYFRQLELKVEIIETIKQVASVEIIQYLLLGRFAFMRNFLPIFNSLSQNRLTSSLYSSLQNAQSKDFTAEILISGLNFSIERNDIQIFDHEGNIYTPRETLSFILRSLPQDMLKTFYWFCTGCFTLPLGGLSSNPIGVVINQTPKLPASRTCFRSLTFNINPALDLHGHLQAMIQALTESTGFNVDEGTEVDNQDVGVFVDVPVNAFNQMEVVGAGLQEAAGNESIEPVVNHLEVIDMTESTDEDD
jgi:hypothetical protein